MSGTIGVLLSALLLAGFSCASAAAQDAPEDTVVRVELTDGSVLIGTVVAETGETVTLRTAAGLEVTMERAQIRRTTTFEGRVDAGRVVIHDSNRTRRLFSPTARPHFPELVSTFDFPFISCVGFAYNF